MGGCLFPAVPTVLSSGFCTGSSILYGYSCVACQVRRAAAFPEHSAIRKKSGLCMSLGIVLACVVLACSIPLICTSISRTCCRMHFDPRMMYFIMPYCGIFASCLATWIPSERHGGYSHLCCDAVTCTTEFCCPLCSFDHNVPWYLVEYWLVHCNLTLHRMSRLQNSVKVWLWVRQGH